MGFPYEGPAPLEAIANGCIFLNPKLSPALNRYNSAFLKSKPTLRALTSQNPYTENFIGSPYVYTFNMEDATSVLKTMEKIMKTDVSLVANLFILFFVLSRRLQGIFHTSLPMRVCWRE